MREPISTRNVAVNKERILADFAQSYLRQRTDLPPCVLSFATRFAGQAVTLYKNKLLVTDAEAAMLIQGLLLEYANHPVFYDGRRTNEAKLVLDNLQKLLNQCNPLWSQLIMERIQRNEELIHLIERRNADPTASDLKKPH